MIALALAALLAVPDAPAPAAPKPSVELTREGGVFRLQAGFEVDAPQDIVWAVLTDYDGMTKFLSSLKKSRVVRKTSQGVLIEQEGSARLLVFSRTIKLRLDVAEHAPSLVQFHDVGGGEFDEYDGSWTLAPTPHGTSVAYQLFAEMKPSMVPRAVARKVLEKSVRRQLEELSAEMVKRAKAARKA
jgi:hypothetical protein